MGDRWVEEEEAVRMSHCGLLAGGWLRREEEIDVLYEGTGGEIVVKRL